MNILQRTLHRPRMVAAYLLGWLLIAALVATNTIASHRLGGHMTPLSRAVPRAVAVCSFWMFAAPLIWRLAERFPVNKDNWPPRLLFHSGSALLFAGGSVPFRVALDLFVPGVRGFPGTTEYLFRYYSSSLFARGVIIYAVFLALSHAILYYRGYLAQTELTGELQAKIAELLADPEPPPDSRFAKRFILRESGRIFAISAQQIDWIEAAGNYVSLHVNGKTHLVRESMAGIQKKLDPQRFVRIHRSAIVQVDRVQEVRTLPGGRFAAVLLQGTELVLGRDGKQQLESLIRHLAPDPVQAPSSTQ